jgi:hypothetical protein
MSHCQCIEYLAHQVGRARSGEATLPRDEFGQIGAVDKLEHKIGVAILLAGIEYRHQIGVSQATDRTGFGQQRVIALRVRARKMQRLYRHLAFELGIPPKIDDALGSASQFTTDFKAADTFFHG